MSDLTTGATGLAVMGTSISPKTLTDSYTSVNSGVITLGKSELVSLGVHYTMGTAETANSIQLKFEVFNKSNAVVAQKTTLAFVDSGPDTITDLGNGFLTAGFVSGQMIKVSGTASNNGIFTVATAVAGTLTLDAGDTLTAEAAGSSFKIEAITTPALRVQTESAVSGTVTRTYREDTFSATVAAALWDRFPVDFENHAYDYLRVWVKETGIAANGGSCFIDAVLVGV